MVAEGATSSPEKRKRRQFWSSRHLSGLRRSRSSPVVFRAQMEASPRTTLEPTAEEDRKEEEHGDVVEYSGVAKDGFNAAGWTDNDAASTHTAFRDELPKSECDGEWAQNLFYAYARRTDDPRFSRFLLTFASARVCAEWWSLIQRHFGGPAANTREGPQFFSFTGDDIPGRAWKHQAFAHLRTQWMYSQIGDAVGAMGKGQEIIPLQDERGFLVQPANSNVRAATPDQERAPSRAGSFAESLGPREKEVMARQLRRTSKRDSGILLPSSPLAGPSHERSQSAPAMSPDAGGNEKALDFERLEQNLAKIEKLMDANALQLRSLEHVQAANLERLTAALVSNAEMVRDLALGQQRLGVACEDLRKAMREREERSERMSVRSMASLGSVGSTAACGHAVKRGPRKLGKAVVGYIYADEPDGPGTKSFTSTREQ
ncbi:uncharacterized protein PV09_06516 [Verruconis gallopava]|uniref:Uncharacterized protein n=1 Tax=Verruconis gallopava TaxID=253628 RepID=A0A0D2A666_9PEZI|nr:uncharacterized protein PV09_06516 [Verruconis gallopava]KIW02010.1 hypothetical protein PV09_06516 [Verruconis gallopava]